MPRNLAILNKPEDLPLGTIYRIVRDDRDHGAFNGDRPFMKVKPHPELVVDRLASYFYDFEDNGVYVHQDNDLCIILFQGITIEEETSVAIAFQE